MTWNYRVVQRDSSEGSVVGIHEVYYDENGLPMWYTTDPSGPLADLESDGSHGLRAVLELMWQALDKPVLHDSVFAPAVRTTAS